MRLTDAEAEILLNNLKRILQEGVEIISLDRIGILTDRAKEIRNLFKKLGIKGFSVTVPKSDLMTAVKIRAKLLDKITKENNWLKCEIINCIERIVLAAFPNSKDICPYKDCGKAHFNFYEPHDSVWQIK